MVHYKALQSTKMYWIMIYIIAILVVLPMVSAVYCFQEFANMSTSCGGVSGGFYWNDTAIDTHHKQNDGNWSSYDSFSDYLYSTYILPSYFRKDTTKVMFKANNGVIYNASYSTEEQIPAQCFSDTNITIYMGFAPKYLGCINITGGKKTIYAVGFSGPSALYEEAMLWDILFLENSQTYNLITSSGEIEQYKINITYDSNYYTSLIANLNYNGTLYNGSITNVGSETIITVNRTIPIVATQTNYTFFWNLTMINSSGNNYFISNYKNQTVDEITISLCTATNNVSYINFSIFNAQSKTSRLNATFKANFLVGKTLAQQSVNYTFSDLTETNKSFAFCLKPSHSTYYMDANIEYDAVNYAFNNYYLIDSTITNTTTNISLYLLNDTVSDLNILKVYDDTQKALENIYIQIQAYDVGTDTFTTVAMAKTDYNGEDLVYLNWYDTFYKFILIQDGEVVKTTNITKIYETTKIFEVPLTFDFDYEHFENLVYTLTYNNLTKNFILTYTDTSGLVSSACLRVTKRTIQNDTTICDTCETSSSATIYCNIGSNNGTFIATFYATGSPFKPIDTLIQLVDINNVLYNLIGNEDGSFYAFLLAGICMAMFFINPALGILGLFLGMLAGMAIGFQPLNYVEFATLAAFGGFIIWILTRR